MTIILINLFLKVTMEFKKHRERFWRHIASMPFIYSMILPAIMMDMCLEIYHRICFPLYGLEFVRRSMYIKIDRHKLSKLNALEKLNCVYCGYVNGLLAYAVEVAARTERYWCGVKHKKEDAKLFKSPKHHEDFLEYEKMK